MIAARLVTATMLLWALPSLAEERRAQDTGYWKLERQTDRLDSAETVAVVLRSPDATSRSPRRSEEMVQAKLVISCRKASPTFLFLVENHLLAGHSARVSYRIDDNPPVTGDGWSKSTDNTAVGFWGGDRPLAMTGRISRGKQLFIRVDDNIFGRTEAIFNVQGLSNAIEPVARHCRWPFPLTAEPVQKRPPPKI